MNTLSLILMVAVSIITVVAFLSFRRNERLANRLEDMEKEEERREKAEKNRREADFMERFHKQEAERERRDLELSERFHKDVAIIAEAIKPLADIGELKGMVDGLIEMTKATASQVDSLNKIAEVLERSISPADPDYRDYAEDTEEGQERVNRSRMEQLMRKGVSPKEAADRIREQTIYDELIKGRR